MNGSLPEAGREGIEQLENGNVVQARNEFARLHVKAGMKKQGVLKTDTDESYWERVEDLAEEATQILHNVGDAAEALKRLEELFEGRVFDSSAITYQGGVGEAEKTVSESDTDEVVQDRIEFLEEEIKRSQEDLMELKEELDELRDE
ncbi:hypothetical protein [Halorarum halobium]|uniref:hypothetical protein n=1 Tax=Halorarum halobium TaxID=3075121 RepID=UPI0028ACDCB2|nr:hypothetical protein [Halobaculum sp. XH14]